MIFANYFNNPPFRIFSIVNKTSVECLSEIQYTLNFKNNQKYNSQGIIHLVA